MASAISGGWWEYEKQWKTQGNSSWWEIGKVWKCPSGDANGKGGGKGKTAQGQVQKAFANQADWESVFADWWSNDVIKEHHGQMLEAMTEKEKKLLQVRTLVPTFRASYALKPGALPGKRTAILNGYRDFAEKKNIPWRADAGELEARGVDVWEAERAKIQRKMIMPEYYKACYEGPIHSYNKGNGEWMAAFDAPSAYLLVHLHHYPDRSPQEAFDALHEELDNLALKHLALDHVRCLDIGCGVGTSTFSTVRSIEKAGLKGKVTGVDLSDYFVAVGQYIQHKTGAGKNGVELQFLHGDGLDLGACGFGASSLDLVVISEVTHEMPKQKSQELFAEVNRVLVPGGVLGYLDLNQVQILRDNPIGALVDRIATSNEPYFDEYLELDAAAAMRKAGLDVLEETWPHHAKYDSLEKCSLRIVIAKKPAELTLDSWTGRWEMQRRENWNSYLTFLGLPEANHEVAAKAQDFHEYKFEKTSFFMDHKIPAQNLHLRFTAFINDDWCVSPYPKPTAVMFQDGENAEEKENVWKHSWVNFPTCLETTMPDFAGKGKTVTLRREIESMDLVKYTVHVLEPTTNAVLVGPCDTWMKRISHQSPELNERCPKGSDKSAPSGGYAK